ncbi:hypothetical protein [Thalassospira sp. 11-3]|uniref:hypothetical protein n=1 Tax=Thalassospira sp. 11-3 TaxID=2135614 RepID=UPI000D87DF94|nr:hypothetical protein [Thalassospira sp. 11-3]PXX25861.1 hypothetical protein C7967_1185 [Thalassospira sp. 11-3]
MKNNFLRHHRSLRNLTVTLFALVTINSNAFAESAEANKSLLDREPIDIESRDQCQNELFELGKHIAASNSYLFSIERSQGGVLTWEEAQAIRERIDRELYWYTEYLRSILTNGDSQKCAQAKIDGIEKINNILRSELEWEDSSQNKQGN